MLFFSNILTKIYLGIAPTFPAFVSVTLWTVLERLVTVPNIVEEMYLVLLREKCSSYAMDGCISPAFVIKTAFFVEEIEEFHVAFASP